MADDESRAARQRALAEKKRRLEEIKARRRQPGGGDAPPPSSSSAATTASGGLDSYIDDLLKSSTPGLTLATPPVDADVPVVEKNIPGKATAVDAEKKDAVDASKADETTPAASTSAASSTAVAPARPGVETFEIAIQCEEDDFPPPSIVDEDEPPEEEGGSDDDDEGAEGSGAANDGDAPLPLRRGASGGSAILRSASHESSSLRNLAGAAAAVAQPLSEEEKAKLLSSPPFTQFLSTASKRVERLLGAGEESLYGILGGSGWGAGGSGGGPADFSADYATEEEEEDYDDYDDDDADGVGGSRKKRRSQKRKTKEEAYQTGGFFTARATYEFPKFTGGRNVTDVEWCPGHKEWILASYNAVAAGSARGNLDGDGAGPAGMTMTPHNPSTRHISPRDPPSSFLQAVPPSSAIPNEGIVAIYNLSMPTRPEHIFCAGCPILHSRFHPTEHPKLILGGASSGQVLVWDARVGRYPVQRSGALSGGHDCELVGMKVLGDDGRSGGAGAGSISTSKLVTASSDGRVNYWSVSNLREPAERVQVNANLSCLEVLHGSNNEGVVCGDERGGLHVILAGTGRDGSGGSKRVVKSLHTGGIMSSGDAPGLVEEDTDPAADGLLQAGHFGMVTAVATRPVMPHANSPRGNKETTSSIAGGVTTKGFMRGAGGLTVTTGVDWSTKLWAPAYSDGPLMSFLSNSYDYMCDVQWSPVHPSVFATASSNGSLNIWNLAVSLDQPVSGTEGVPVDRLPADAATSSRHGLNRLRWSSDGRRMAVASGDKLHVLGAGEDVWKAKGDEEGRVMHNLVSRGLIQQE